MASEPKTITVEPSSELDQLLDDVADLPLRLVRGGEAFRLDVASPVARAADGDDDEIARRLARPPSPEEVERSREGIRRAAGAWQGIVDADALLAYIRQRRRMPGRPLLDQ